MSGHPFPGDADRLRAPERVARLEVGRVVRLSLEGARIGSVLDVGTGSGLFAEAFARALAVEAAPPPRVAGIDLDEAALARARALVPGVDFRQGAAEALPFADGEFDLVFLGLVLHESRDPLRALQEARRVARRRVAILEWPCRRQDAGPPLKDRLPEERIAGLVAAAGFGPADRIELPYPSLYRLDR